jgi:molybdopterin converting factor subunit 1
VVGVARRAHEQEAQQDRVVVVVVGVDVDAKREGVAARLAVGRMLSGRAAAGAVHDLRSFPQATALTTTASIASTVLGQRIKPRQAHGKLSHRTAHAHLDGAGAWSSPRGCDYVWDMRLRLRYFAAAAEAAGLTEETLELPASGRAPTLADVRLAVLERRPSLARILAHSRLALDQRFARDEDVVVDGAEVAVIPPVAGG